MRNQIRFNDTKALQKLTGYFSFNGNMKRTLLPRLEVMPVDFVTPEGKFPDFWILEHRMTRSFMVGMPSDVTPKISDEEACSFLADKSNCYLDRDRLPRIKTYGSLFYEIPSNSKFGNKVKINYFFSFIDFRSEEK